jgi:hypothetical protein
MRANRACQRCPSSAPWSSFSICSIPCARAFASDASARSDRCISLPCLRMAHCQAPSDLGFGPISRVYGYVLVGVSVMDRLCHPHPVRVI